MTGLNQKFAYVRTYQNSFPDVVLFDTEEEAKAAFIAGFHEEYRICQKNGYEDIGGVLDEYHTYGKITINDTYNGEPMVEEFYVVPMENG